MASIVRWLFIPTLLTGWILSANSAQAIVPQVKDDAGIFSASAMKKANEIIRAIQRRHRKDLVMETRKTPSAGAEKTARGREREQFFSQWAKRRSNELGVDGVYVVVSLPPVGHVEAAVGTETAKHAFTSSDGKHLQE